MSSVEGIPKKDVEMKDDSAKPVEEDKKEEVYEPFFGKSCH